MTSRNPRRAEHRRAPGLDWPLHLDLLGNPYGPSIRVQEAIAAAADLHHATADRERQLRRSLGEMSGFSPDQLVLTSGIDDAVLALCSWRRQTGPLILFPPTDPGVEHLARLVGIETVQIARSYRFAVEIEPDHEWEAPESATAYVMSPNDPTGTVLGTQDLVRLLRRCSLVVVDERHGDYGARSLVPLVREFDNLIVLKSFETWAGLSGFPFAYVIAPPQLADQIARYRLRRELAASSLIAAEATLADLNYVRASAHRIREEKSRLYRMLRKLNMVRPLPSWANFMLVRVERGEATLFLQELSERGIAVARPCQPELENHLRISAVGPESTFELKRALIDIASTL